MIDVFLCEDNLAQRVKIETIIKNYITIENLNMQLTLSTDSPLDLFDYLTAHPQTKGIYFLDIDLHHEINGIQLGAMIRNLCIDGKIIFVTTYNELLPLTFKHKVEAMDYITKEDSEEMARRIREAIDQAHRHYTSEKTSFDTMIKLTIGHQIRLFSLNDIMYFETSANSHKLMLHLSNASVEFYGNLTEIADLSPAFVRAHQAYVVNQQSIVQIDKKKREITFRNGQTCWASTRQVNHLFRVLEKKKSD